MRRDKRNKVNLWPIRPLGNPLGSLDPSPKAGNMGEKGSTNAMSRRDGKSKGRGPYRPGWGKGICFHAGPGKGEKGCRLQEGKKVSCWVSEGNMSAMIQMIGGSSQALGGV